MVQFPMSVADLKRNYDKIVDNCDTHRSYGNNGFNIVMHLRN
jgi:hypothetical protein